MSVIGCLCFCSALHQQNTYIYDISYKVNVKLLWNFLITIIFARIISTMAYTKYVYMRNYILY